MHLVPLVACIFDLPGLGSGFDLIGARKKACALQTCPKKGESPMSSRRTFKPEFKAGVVLEELTGVKSAAEVCREHKLKPQVFARWKTEFIERAPEIFATRPSRGDEKERIADLEQMVGRLTMELEAAKKASNILTSFSTRKGR